MERSVFLAGVRSRLAGVEKPASAVPPDWAVEIDDPVARFAAELTAVGGKVQRTTEADAPWVLAEWPGSTVVIDDEPGVPEGLADVVRRSGGRVHEWPSSAQEIARDVDVGVTSALWGVAETGSVLVSSAPPGGRSPGLVPPVHVVFLPTGRIVPTTAELFARIAAMEDRPSALTLVTGPSKSADIGNELMVGVHGPGEFYVILVE
jgi:L-lactate dehydrogenase complex protein LldG